MFQGYSSISSLIATLKLSVLTSTKDWNWWFLSNFQQRGNSTPAFTLKSACKHYFLDPCLLCHWTTPVVWEWIWVELGSSTKQGEDSVAVVCAGWSGAWLCRSLEVTAGLTSSGSCSQDTAHLGRAARGSCTLPSPTWTWKQGAWLPVNSRGTLFAWGLFWVVIFLLFSDQVFPRRGSSPHKWCRGEWLLIPAPA